jgi:ubiquinone/menaquinone biosynthesis C-methylase UbiE
MTRRKYLAAILAVFALALCGWFEGAVRARTNAAPIPDASGEIPRLADAMRWTAGITIADIGAGDGSYSFAAAKIAGASGRVYATEIDGTKLNKLRETIAKRKLTNVVVVEGAADDTKLPSECCDAIFIRHVYHHITAPDAFDKNLLRSLKPGGRLAIIDFPPENSLAPVEGVPANRGGHGIPQKIMTDELTAAGFRVEKTIDHWSGNDYCVIFVKPTL